jgi:tRNA A-37 threonylcarbamoyl transferase component Bud32
MTATVANSNRRLRWWVEGPSSPLLEALLADPDQLLTGRASVARQRVGRKRFYRLSAEEEGPGLYVKIFPVARGWPRLLSFLRSSKARREATVAAAIRSRGFEVAGPVAVGEERVLGTLVRSFSAVAEREGRDLRDLLSDPAIPPSERRDLVVRFGTFARRLHDAGIDQDDFSPNNFLVDPAGDFVLLDFERCRVGAPLEERRWKLLAKLHRHDLSVPRTDRLRLLRAYLGEETGRRERRKAWEQIDAAFWRIRRRDARRAGRAAFRVGRNVARSAETWIVRERESEPVRRLELDGSAARQGWVVAHQLERLGLPALRPVRLGPSWLELLEPPPPPPGVDPDAAVQRAKRCLARYGAFTGEPEWAFSAEGALLADPTCFQLRL